MGDLINNVNNAKNGISIANMPDILVVPNSWIWQKNGLVKNESIVSLNDFNSYFNLEDEKYNDAFSKMSTYLDKVYSANVEMGSNPLGIFQNRTIVDSIGLTGNYIVDKQREGKWTSEELNTILENAISNDIKSRGIKLFADNEYLIHGLLIAFGVDFDPYKLNPNSEEFKNAVSYYQKLKENELLLEGTEDQILRGFKENKLIFLPGPYEKIAPNFLPKINRQIDNTVVKYFSNWNNFGAQSVRTPSEGSEFKVTVKEVPAGRYELPIDNWNFVLFPKKDLASKYNVPLIGASYPVILSSTENKEDAAFILSQLMLNYDGVNNFDYLLNRGGNAYHINRINNFNRDKDSLLKASFFYGVGDNLSSSKIINNLTPLIKSGGDQYAKMNVEVSKLLDFAPDLAALGEKVGQANAKLESGYTAESWKAFNQVVVEVEKVFYKRPYATQTEIDKALETITNAENDLVEVNVSATGVELDTTETTIEVGSTKKLIATVSPSNATNKNVTWSSNKASVATVSTEGVVTAKGTGTATITVTTEDGNHTATATITVVEPTPEVSVQNVVLDVTKATLEIGQTKKLVATVKPSNATNKNVTWSSNRPAVATVNSEGVVTAKAIGTATIIVTTQDGDHSAMATITVQKPTVVDATGVELDVTEATLEVDATKTAVVVRPILSRLVNQLLK